MAKLAEQIPFLSRCLQGTDIELLECTNGQDAIRLRRSSAGLVRTASTSAGSSPLDITAPSVGIFRRAHPLQTTPLAQAGQPVTEGDPVGLLQIGALLIQVPAPTDGVVLDVVAEDGAAVGYGTTLVRMTGGRK